MHPLEEQKKEIELSIAQTIETQLEKQAITEDDAQQIARFVLKEIDSIQDEESFLLFLQSLFAKWPIFENLYNLYKIKVKDTKETQEGIQKVQADISALAS